MPDTTKLRCRGCNADLAKDDRVVVRVAEGVVESVEEGSVDFTPGDNTWGYMHKKCFLLAVGDPEAITMMG